MTVDLAILDVNGTLFSLDPVAARLAEVGLDGRLEVWFTRILRDGFAAAAAGTFAAFPDLARHHLTALLEQQGQEATDDRIDHVLGGFTAVTAHPDVEPGLTRLHDAGVTVATMTNGTVAITRDFLGREGLDGLVDDTHDVAAVGAWKPATQAYRHVLEEHDTVPQQAALFAVHPWDIHGAVIAGLLAGWVNRDDAPYPDPFAPPTVRGRTFVEVVEALLAHS